MNRVYDVNTVVDGKYRVVREIGAGGMGVVLSVVPVAGGGEIALKYCGEPEDANRRRFSREVRAMSAITHPNVMPVLDSNIGADPPYYTMPLAANTVADMLPALATDEPKVLSLFAAALDGVHAIHAAGQTHRDLKPMNLLVLADGRLVVSDLGLVKLDPRDTTVLTQTAAFVGTRAYCAPEQMILGGSRAADGRTDVYQLGKTLYEMLTGDSPALIDEDKVSKGLFHIIVRATESDPKRRYQSVAQLRDAVQMYELANNPGANPLAAFDTQLEQIDRLLKKNQYNPEMLATTCALVLQLRSDNTVYLNAFERIPKAVLPILAKHISQSFLPALEAYANAVDAEARTKSYEYAEVVATRMKLVFQSATEPKMKSVALRALLSAAAQLNRFAAMAVFDDLLLSVSDPADAIEIAQMLKANIVHYRMLAPRTPGVRLPAPIRAVREECV